MIMKILFWILLLLILHTYLFYPLVLVIVGMVRGKRVKRADATPLVTLIIPAYNEEKVISRKIENSLELDYPKDKLEIIIASDGSTDKTNDIVREFAVKGVTLFAFEERKGKPSLYYRSVPKANGGIIVFSDADAILTKNAVKNIVKNFNDERIGCVEGVRIDSDPQGIPLESIYWKYETFIKKQAAKLFSSLGATGALFAIRKELYFPISETRGDDFEIPVRVLISGHGVTTDTESIAYHPWLPNEDEFKRIARIVAFMLPSAGFLLAEALKKHRFFVVFQLISHKFLRWFVPVLLILLFLANMGLWDGFYRNFLGIQTLFYFMALCGLFFEKKHLKVVTIFKIPYYFCLINLASLVGIFRFIFGKAAVNWEKTKRG